MFEMEKNGFPLDKDECHKQISHLQERMDWVDSYAVPSIPARIKPKGATVEKIYKLNGQYTKQVSDWIREIYGDSTDTETESLVAGCFCRIEYTPINLGSDKQVKEWLLKNGWQPREWNYKKVNGREVRNAFGDRVKTSPKITDESLDDLETLGPIAKLIGYRTKARHKKSQIEGFIRNCRPDGRLSSKVNSIGAATRRMTHSQIANVPNPGKESYDGHKTHFLWKPMRKVFCSEGGYKIVGADADQCQVRGLAHYLDDAEFIHALQYGKKSEGTDIHSLNGARAGVTRQHAKGVFYGYLFGAGVAKTASQLGVSEEVAADIRKKFEKGLPALTKLLKELSKFWKKNGYILGIAGNRIYVDSEHMLLVYLLQDYEQFLMKVALCFAYDAIKKQELDAEIVTMQHDEFQFHVKEEHAARVAYILEDSIIKAGTFIKSKCPIKGEAEIGDTWYDTH
jgi:DNA polymerase I-like protein with 3'-5' exonuclease and polymerase domains